MNTAEQLMVVKGLIEGLSAAERKLKADLLRTSQELSVGTFKTRLGSVSVSSPQPSIEILPDVFLAYCQEHHPDEVVTVPQVRSSFVTATAARLRIAGGDVVDADGVVVDFARVAPAGEPVASGRLSANVKTQARVQVAEALDGLLGVLQIEATR